MEFLAIQAGNKLSFLWQIIVMVNSESNLASRDGDRRHMVGKKERKITSYNTIYIEILDFASRYHFGNMRFYFIINKSIHVLCYKYKYKRKCFLLDLCCVWSVTPLTLNVYISWCKTEKMDKKNIFFIFFILKIHKLTSKFIFISPTYVTC